MKDVQATLDGYIEQIKQRVADDGHIQIKELAFILDTGEKKIRNDIERGRLGMFKMGPPESRCHIRIPEIEAINYVLQFYTSSSDLPPIEESPLFSRISRVASRQEKGK